MSTCDRCYQSLIDKVDYYTCSQTCPKYSLEHIFFIYLLYHLYYVTGSWDLVTPILTLIYKAGKSKLKLHWAIFDLVNNLN